MNISHRGSPYTSFLIAGFLLLIMCFLLLLPTSIWDAANDGNTPFSGAETQLLFAAVCAVMAAGFAIWGSIQLRDRRIAAMEPLTQSPAQLNAALRDALGFTEDELHANRMGMFSEQQESRIDKQYRQSRGCLWVYMLGLLALCAFVTVGGLLGAGDLGDLRRALERSPEMQLTYLIAGGIFVTALIGSFMYTFRRNRLAAKLAIQSVEGVARLYIYHGRYGSAGCQVRIGRKRFYLSVEQGEGFWNGAPYRVYFVRTAYYPTLLSAEVVDGPLVNDGLNRT